MNDNFSICIGTWRIIIRSSQYQLSSSKPCLHCSCLISARSKYSLFAFAKCNTTCTMFVIPSDLDFAKPVFLLLPPPPPANVEKILAACNVKRYAISEGHSKMDEPRRVQFSGNEDGAYSPMLYSATCTLYIPGSLSLHSPPAKTSGTLDKSFVYWYHHRLNRSRN